MSDTAKNGLLVAVIGVLGVYIVLQYDPTLFGILQVDGFKSSAAMLKQKRKEGFADKLPPPLPCPFGQELDPQTGRCKTKLSRNDDMIPNPQFQSGKANPADAAKEGFADLASMEGPASFGSAEAPAGCYPRAQLTPVQLLPADQDSIYAQQNPMGVGSLKGKNFLSAGALIGVNTVGQTLRNANLQLRSEPPNPQVSVSIFNQSTIQSDVNRRPLEVGCT
jgi:hypothetical protein